MTANGEREAPSSGASGAAPREATWKLVASWLFVGVPAAWGIAQVLVKSLALFR